MYLYLTILKAFEIEVRAMFRVPCWETFVTNGKNHVSKDSLSIEHSSQQFLTESCMNLCRAYRHVVGATDRYLLWQRVQLGLRDLTQFLACLTA